MIKVRQKRKKNNLIYTTISFGCKLENIDKIYSICRLLNISSFRLQLFNINELKQQSLLFELDDDYIINYNYDIREQNLYIDFKAYDIRVFHVLSKFEFDEFNLVDLQYNKQLTNNIIDFETINKTWLNYNLKEYGLVTIDIFGPIKTELIANVKQVIM